jgi:hypothetical protein
MQASLLMSLGFVSFFLLFFSSSKFLFLFLIFLSSPSSFLCSEYVTDVSAITARHAIQSIGQISGSVPNSMGHTLEKLLSFSDLEIDYVTAGTLVAIRGEIFIQLIL